MYVARSENRICQGDILEDFKHRFIYYQNEEKAIIEITLPYAIVLSQDCDLEQDYNQRNPPKGIVPQNNDKFLQSVLICPGYIAESFRTGEHLKKIGLTMQSWNKEQWNYIKKNQNQRFHFFESDPGMGMPNIVIDFKQYYTIPRDEIYTIYKLQYKVSVAPIFREDISLRFANYLSRIGLPVIQTSVEQTAVT